MAVEPRDTRAEEIARIEESNLDAIGQLRLQAQRIDALCSVTQLAPPAIPLPQRSRRTRLPRECRYNCATPAREQSSSC
jgi:hypothetical protein